MLLRNIYTICYIFYIVVYEYIQFKIFNCDRNTLYFNILNKISKIDIFFVKLMQWIIMDINDEVLKNMLIQFSNNVQYNDYEINREIINELKNKNIIIENTPINSGTIAIVFKGSYDNKNIIIKLKRNNIKKILKNSISLMSTIAFLIKFTYYRYLKIDLFIETNMSYLFEQINFINEITNINTFYNNFKNNNEIIIPKVYSEFSNNDVIVMEYINGISIHELIKNNYNKNLLTYPNNFFIESIMKYNLLHSDLHQGNILFLNDTKQVGIIDFGLVKKLDSKEKQLMLYYLIGMYSSLDKFKNIIINKLIEKVDDTINNIDYDKLLLDNTLNEFIKDKDKGCLHFIKINKILEKYNLKMKNSFFKVIFHIAPFIDFVKYLSKLNEHSVSLTALNKYKNQLIYNKLK